ILFGGTVARLPEIERRHGQDAVRLRPTAHSRKRSEAAHVLEKVRAGPFEISACQPRLGSDHVAEEISPADLPERRVHGTHGAAILGRATLDPSERRDRKSTRLNS